MIHRVLTKTVLIFFVPYLSAQNTLLPVVRQLDVSSNILTDGCATYNSNYYELKFDLTQRDEQYALNITSAGAILDVNTLAPLMTNQDYFKDCSIFVCKMSCCPTSFMACLFFSLSLFSFA